MNLWLRIKTPNGEILVDVLAMQAIQKCNECVGEECYPDALIKIFLPSGPLVINYGCSATREAEDARDDAYERLEGKLDLCLSIKEGGKR